MHTQGSEGLASVRARPSFLSTYLRMQCLRKKNCHAQGWGEGYFEGSFSAAERNAT